MLDVLKKKLLKVIKDFPELKIQMGLWDWETDFLRFFKSQVNYNISKNIVYASVSIYKDQKNYTFSMNNPTEKMIRERIVEVKGIIDKLPPDPHFVDLENDTRKGEEASKENNILKMPLERKVEILQWFSDAVKPFDFDIYGTFICNRAEGYILNSNGLDKKVAMSPYYLEIKAVSNKNEVTVLECVGGERVDRIDVSKMIDSLVKKVKVAQNEVVDVDAGEYEVVLSPRCIGDLMAYYAWSNLSVASVDRKETDLEGKVGEKIFPEFFTLVDSPKHADVVNLDYNSDGHLYEDLTIFENGVFKSFLVDNYHAHKLKMEKNGNEGNCLVMKEGNISLDYMIQSIKKGLYISSFHYMNFINTRETSLTGLTRDGTFMIEDGKITKVVNNLRFTEKIVDIINNITNIENRLYTFPMSENYGCFSINAYAMPHVQVKDFKISSSTKTV